MGGSWKSGGGVFGTRRAISAASSVFFFTSSGLGLGGGGGGGAAERFPASPGFAASYASPAATNLRVNVAAREVSPRARVRIYTHPAK